MRVDAVPQFPDDINDYAAIKPVCPCNRVFGRFLIADFCHQRQKIVYRRHPLVGIDLQLILLCFAMNHSGEPRTIQITAILVIGLPQIFTDIQRRHCFIRSVIQCLHAPTFDDAVLLGAVIKIGIPNVAVPDKDALDAPRRAP